MTKSTITRERIQRIIRAIDSEAYDEEEIREWLSSDEIMELSRMALVAMDSEPVAWVVGSDEIEEFNRGREVMVMRDCDDEELENLPLYRHAQPSPVVPEGLRMALSNAGIAAPESDEMLAATHEKYVQALVMWVRDRKPFQPAPVVPDEMLCEFYEVANWPDLVRELVKHVERLQDSAKRNVKPWEDTFPETLLPAYIDRIKQADEACRAAMLQAGNSPQSMKCKTADELLACVPRNTGRSREHFISLCNEFWNWSEMDLVCADEKGYEPTMEWNGTKFTHRVTQALWRMYQAAPVNSPVIPDGYVMVPKEPTAEMIAAAMNCDDVEFNSDETFCVNFDNIYAAMVEAAPQEVKGE